MVVRADSIPLGLAMALGGLGIGWVAAGDALCCPIFMTTNSAGSMVENFGQLSSEMPSKPAALA